MGEVEICGLRRFLFVIVKNSRIGCGYTQFCEAFQFLTLTFFILTNARKTIWTRCQ